jgi:hypothetical protein
MPVDTLPSQCTNRTAGINGGLGRSSVQRLPTPPISRPGWTHPPGHVPIPNQRADQGRQPSRPTSLRVRMSDGVASSRPQCCHASTARTRRDCAFIISWGVHFSRGMYYNAWRLFGVITLSVLSRSPSVENNNPARSAKKHEANSTSVPRCSADLQPARRREAPHDSLLHSTVHTFLR